MLPTFVIIGAQKAATTALWHHLGSHPQVFVSAVKEPDYFVAEMAWSRGQAWYESLFDGAGDAVAVGEASPSYTMYPSLAGVPERMAGVVPEARLVYLVRHPVERMRSGYLHALAMGRETRPMAEALLSQPQYADTSRYAFQLDQYLRLFDPSQVLVLPSEELAARPGDALDRVLDHLGLPTGWRPSDLGARVHETAGKRVPRTWWRLLGGLVIRARVPEFEVPARIARSRLTTRPLPVSEATLSADLRRRLEDLLRPDVERLRTYLGPDFDGWGLLA